MPDCDALVSHSPQRPKKGLGRSRVFWAVWLACFLTLLYRKEAWPFHPRQIELEGYFEPLTVPTEIPRYPFDFGKFYFTSDDGKRYAISDARLKEVIDAQGENLLATRQGYSLDFERHYRLRGIQRDREKVIRKRFKWEGAASHFEEQVTATNLFEVIRMEESR